MQLSDFLSAARVSILDPRGGFALMRSLRLERAILFMALAAVSVVGVIIAAPLDWYVEKRGEVSMIKLAGGPLKLAALQFGAGLVSAILIYFFGRGFGGKASYEDSLLVFIWMQCILTLIQIPQIVLLVVLPPLAPILVIVPMMLVFWLSSGFVAEAHGFRSQFKTFVGIVMCGFLLIFALALVVVVLVKLGILPEMPNV